MAKTSKAYACGICGRDEDLGSTPPIQVVVCSDCPSRVNLKAAHSTICTQCALDGYSGSLGTMDLTSQPMSLVCVKCTRFALLSKKSALVNNIRNRCSAETIGAVTMDLCPWMTALRQASPEDLRTALRHVKRHRAPHEDRLDDALWNGPEGPSVGTSMMILGALQAPNAPNSAAAKYSRDTLEALRMSNAPHTKYFDLFMKEGACLDKASAYFARVASETDRPLVAALAQERVYLCKCVRKLYSPYVANNKNKPPPVVAGEGMRVIYDLCRTLSRMIKDAARAETDELLTFETNYGYLIKYAIPAASKVKRVAASSPAPKGPQQHKPPPATPAPPQAGADTRDRSRSPRRKGKKKKGQNRTNAPGDTAKQPSPPVKKESSPAPTAQQKLALERIRNIPQAVRDARACINCYAASGKAGEKHSFAECRALGNPCLAPCKLCPDYTFHYRMDCPKNAKK